MHICFSLRHAQSYIYFVHNLFQDDDYIRRLWIRINAQVTTNYTPIKSANSSEPIFDVTIALIIIFSTTSVRIYQIQKLFSLKNY